MRIRFISFFTLLTLLALATGGCGTLFGPKITSIELDRPEVPRYESIEFKLAIDAKYENPYDARQVRLDGVFKGPDGSEMKVPGFWDGEEAWRLRFTPSLEGEWNYQLVVTDSRGASKPAGGTFNVTPSDLHGWLQIGSMVDPSYSPRYLAYHDGTPFYGLGYCEALNILIDKFSTTRGVILFENMQAAGENFVVWWPLYSNSFIGNSYADYSSSNLTTIDMVVADAQKKGLHLVFTIWDHPELRDNTHAWGDGQWPKNGFNKLGDINSFFTSDEAWAWQENLYRYIIARWGYSPAIGMWQTVSEINGTNAYDQTDPWHAKVNAYFVANDPYRHPTTASQSGDVPWSTGWQVMDMPQVHLYDFPNGDSVKAAEILVRWTMQMWDDAEKPNWVGEFGVKGNSSYPELFHNSLWAALASGAAMTPAEWNSGGTWGRPTDEMKADMARLGQFVTDIPLAKLNPSRLELSSGDPQVRGWGVAGRDGGVFWVQDFALEGQGMEAVRANQTIRSGVTVDVAGLAEGTYTVLPYDTWQGVYLTPFEITCAAGQACAIPLPDFKADMAFKITRN